MDTRTAIINAVAARQEIYGTKRSEAFEEKSHDRFDRMSMAVEVCGYLLFDILEALGLPPHDADPDEFIVKPIPAFPENA